MKCLFRIRLRIRPAVSFGYGFGSRLNFIFLRSVRLFCCSKIGGEEIGDREGKDMSASMRRNQTSVKIRLPPETERKPQVRYHTEKNSICTTFIYLLAKANDNNDRQIKRKRYLKTVKVSKLPFYSTLVHEWCQDVYPVESSNFSVQQHLAKKVINGLKIDFLVKLIDRMPDLGWTDLFNENSAIATECILE